MNNNQNILDTLSAIAKDYDFQMWTGSFPAKNSKDDLLTIFNILDIDHSSIDIVKPRIPGSDKYNDIHIESIFKK